MTGKIFLSYRREDTAGFAQALFGRLEQSFPAESLFMDVAGGIGAGQNFARVIEEQVSACDAMLVLIGPNWLNAKDDSGRRRLENPEDFVRVEVESALRFGKHVIPVLVQKAEMPRADAMPDPRKALALRHAVGLTHERFKGDARGLIKEVEVALAEAAAAKERRVAEEAAKAEEAARAEKERARLDAIASLSPEQIAKAEELANWDFIKASGSLGDFRDHLARFPQGGTERWARKRLEALVWAALPQPIDTEALKGFLAEFPKGAHASEATAKPQAAAREKREMDASAAGTVATFAGHTEAVNSVAFSPDGHSALSGSNDETVKLWDVPTGRELRRIAAGRVVRSVAFSPDGRSALSDSRDNLKLWNVATGKEIRTFTGHTYPVNSVAFSQDGRTALSGSTDETIKLWDVATGREIRSFAGHKKSVASVVFSPDGRTALSGSADKTLKIWDVATGREIRAFAGHTDRVKSVAFSPMAAARCRAAPIRPSSYGTSPREKRSAASPGTPIGSIRSRSRPTGERLYPAVRTVHSSSGT